MIRVRHATEKDIPEMLSIYNDIILNTTAVYDYKPHTLEMRQAWYRSKQEQGYPVFVADEEGAVVGFSSIGPFRNWAAYKYSVENSIYVKSDMRGRGIGKLLIPPVIEAARQLQMHTVIAGIDATNESSIRLHKSFGFEETAHFRQVGYKFGRWLDLKFFQLILNTPEKPEEK